MNILFFLGLTLTGFNAPANDPLALLRPLVGDWTIVTSTQTEDGTWKATEPTSSNIKSVLNGKVIEERMIIQMGPYRLNMLVLFSYDPFRKIYRVAAIDDGSGMMDIAEGQIEGQSLIVNNLRAGTFFPFGEGREGAFRLTLTVVDADKFTFQADISFDKGKTWGPYSKSVYTRSKS